MSLSVCAANECAPEARLSGHWCERTSTQLLLSAALETKKRVAARLRDERVPQAIDVRTDPKFLRTLRDFFSDSREPMVIVHPGKDQILEANEHACSLLGYTHRELIRRHVSEIHPEDMPELIRFADSIEMAGPGRSGNLSCLTKSGEILPAEEK